MWQNTKDGMKTRPKHSVNQNAQFICSLKTSCYDILKIKYKIIFKHET